jgi:hypothetical protein
VTTDLHAEIDDIAGRFTMLRSGMIFHWAMNVVPEQRFGRIVGAQLTALMVRGHVVFDYGTEFVGPPGMIARRTTSPDPLAGEEQQLLELLFGHGRQTRLAAGRSGAAWDALSNGVHGSLRAEGLGFLRPARGQMRRRIGRLRRAMREHARVPGRRWADDPDLHRRGLPFAVLFNLDTGDRHWPKLDSGTLTEYIDSELFVPAFLPLACTLGIDAST